MEYTNLGNSGLKVSRICLGCMSFGNDTDWKVEAEDAKKVLNRAWDLGINYFDTSNNYSHGRSEEILGDFIKNVRESAVIATKVFRPMGLGPNDRGLSKKATLHQFRESLKRLRTDYIDLYQIHRWDNDTPVEETLSTLTNLVHEGGVRYIGASSMRAWQLAKALYTSDLKGYARFVSMQNLYNLLYREEEREMIPLCLAEKVGLVPWSPTAVGLLSGRLLRDGKLALTGEQNPRNAPESPWSTRYSTFPENVEIIRRVVEVAKENGATPIQVSLAWLIRKGVASPVFGTRRADHVNEVVGSLDVKLSDKQSIYLEEPYIPKPVTGID